MARVTPKDIQSTVKRCIAWEKADRKRGFAKRSVAPCVLDELKTNFGPNFDAGRATAQSIDRAIDVADRNTGYLVGDRSRRRRGRR